MVHLSKQRFTALLRVAVTTKLWQIGGKLVVVVLVRYKKFSEAPV
jgi:hypothetical protein